MRKNFLGRDRNKNAASASTNYTCPLGKTLRAESDTLFNSLGMSLNTAINVFLRKAVSVGGFPFDVTVLSTPSAQSPTSSTTPMAESNQISNQLMHRHEVLNRETIEAMLEAERIAHDPNAKSYTVEEAFAELNKD